VSFGNAPNTHKNVETTGCSANQVMLPPLFFFADIEDVEDGL